MPRDGLGGAAARDAPPRRRGRLAALALPAEFGGHDASNLEMAIIREHLAHQGPRAAQRPAERVVDRRQLPDRADDARLRHARAEGRVDARLPRRHAPARVRAHRAEPRLRRDLPRDHGRARRRRVGDQRHEAVQLRAAPRHPRHRLRPHLGRAGRARSASPRSSCRPTRPASRSSSSGGRSTCRPTTPR